jgi:myo-inositol-1(or 4)-monophosphatase
VSPNALRDLAAEAARRGAAALMPYYGRPFRVTMKADGAGPVTDADLASQTAIVETLRSSGIAILAEEDGLRPDGALRRWIVDPLDGTTNFIRHLPWFCVGIALATADNVDLGVVYAPLTDELFIAERGRGTTLNGTRQRVSDVALLSDSCLHTSCDRGMCRVPERLERFARVASRVGELRSPNAAVLDLAYVAAGRVDGFWEQGLAPWDLAAGSLLVREAGGKTSDFRGRPVQLASNEIVASNGQIHDELTVIVSI